MRNHFAMMLQSIEMAVDNIRSNKLRSFLTMLGIVIGVASVIALVTIVQSVTGSVMSQFEGLGAGTISIAAPGTVLNKGLSDTALDELRATEGVAAISPSASMSTSAVYQDTITKNISVNGCDPVYFLHNTDQLSDGRVFSSAENDGQTNVAIVDKDFVKNVLRGNAALGTEFTLDGYTYKVIGIRKPSDSLTAAMTDTSQVKGTVTIPYKNVLRMQRTANVTSVDVYYGSPYTSSQVEANLRKTLNRIYNDADNAFSIINLESLMNVMNSVRTMLSTMLGGIASIALVVGGIGIMNMMLVSVSERTKEIGLRKALGAEPVRIQSQFLIESITLSVIGGLIGILLGLLIAFIGAKVLKTTFSISYGAIVLGAGFSAAVGIIFGWMPAKRASALNPIDALRSE